MHVRTSRLCRTMLTTTMLLMYAAGFGIATQKLPAAESHLRAAAAGVPDALYRYVSQPDDVFAWRKVSEATISGQGHVTQLQLTSQIWQDITWQHTLMVYEPLEVNHPDHMLLFISGGKNGGVPPVAEQIVQLQLAKACGAPVAMLHQVPNQPLLGGKVEDDLITDTWLRYLETGDEKWPLLFPMVKSAVRAMDALQQFSTQHRQHDVTGFVLTGASKRGWTSWLVPVVDDRVIATAPIVIDILNFPKQMNAQLETWGQYSEQIADYTRKGLVKPAGVARTEREVALWQMMDPYTYRGTLDLPKLIILGTNDRYWLVNATNNYWDDLQGPCSVVHVPNVGHNLNGGREQAGGTLAAFFRRTVQGKEMPVLKWTAQQSADSITIEASSSEPSIAARLWSTTSATRDFRDSTWTSTKLELNAGDARGTVAVPAGQHGVAYIEFQFTKSEPAFSLTTLVYESIP